MTKRLVFDWWQFLFYRGHVCCECQFRISPGPPAIISDVSGVSHASGVSVRCIVHDTVKDKGVGRAATYPVFYHLWALMDFHPKSLVMDIHAPLDC